MYLDTCFDIEQECSHENNLGMYMYEQRVYHWIWFFYIIRLY